MSILFTLDDCNKVEEITMAWPSNGYTLKAGTPVSATGIANDGNAIGVLAEDAKIADAYFYGADASAAADYKFRVLTAGYVNIKAAEASFGDEYTDACKTALATAGIVLCDEDDASSFGGGGGGSGVVVVNFTSAEGSLTADKTVTEILEAMKTGAVIGIVNGVTPIGAGIAGAESEVYFGQQYTDSGFAPLLMGTLDGTWMYIPDSI